jgi:immune inhibitor A
MNLRTIPLRMPGPLFVGPSPEVLKTIRAEVRRQKYTAGDRRMLGVAAFLGVEPSRRVGLNEGIFYPVDALPARARGLGPARAARSRPTTGTLRLLVLLVDFPDNEGKRSPSELKEMLFSRGTYATGSMWDYYNETSYKQLDVQGDVHGWIRLPNPYSYYVNGDNGCDDTNYPHNAVKMVEDALAAAAQTVDFRSFDADGDKFLDGLFVVHAGSGAETDPNEATRAGRIWSHQWNISKPFVSSGVTAYAYLTVPEDCRVGVCCHEFGHMLGLPDLYDTTYQTEGVGAWCVMGAGNWNGGGKTPGHFCAWAKARLGWIKPKVVKSAGKLKLAAVEGQPAPVYRLWTKGKGGDEYFLIENRQRVGFDAKLPAAGLLIYRINDASHNNDHPGDYWVGVQQADGKRDLELGRNGGDKGDPYPGSSRNTTFDGRSSPASLDHLGRATGVAVTGIVVKNGEVVLSAKV